MYSTVRVYRYQRNIIPLHLSPVIVKRRADEILGFPDKGGYVTMCLMVVVVVVAGEWIIVGERGGSEIDGWTACLGWLV
jgi:hypothetical protein